MISGGGIFISLKYASSSFNSVFVSGESNVNGSHRFLPIVYVFLICERCFSCVCSRKRLVFFSDGK